MFSVPGFLLRFTFSWCMTLLMIIAVSILVYLGTWQVSRAHEKERMLNSFEQSNNLTPVEWQGNIQNPPADQLIKTQGKYLDTILLLDNQHYRHQFGYDVLSPLLLDNGSIVLVDRGWVVGDSLREKFPEISVPNSKIKLIGHVYYPSSKVWVLGPEIENKNNQLAIIEDINTKNLSLFLHKSVYPFIIRLDARDPWSYVRDWQVVAMSPARHYGYAVQWFAMALVVFIIYVALNVKKKL